MEIKELSLNDIYNGYSDCLKEIGVFFIAKIELERFVQYLLKKNSKIFCFYINNIVAGTITIDLFSKKNKNSCYITNLCVQKKYRGQNISYELLEHCYNFAKDNMCHELCLHCESNMISFYEKNGFFCEGNCMRRKINV